MQERNMCFTALCFAPPPPPRIFVAICCVREISFCSSKFIFTLLKVAARSKAWTVFASSNAGIVGSNPTQGMNDRIVCVYYVVFCV
jgi:hypothetical protein